MDTLRAGAWQARIDDSPAAQAEVALDGTITSANRRFGSMAGIPAELLRGRQITELLEPADGPALGAPDTPPYGLLGLVEDSLTLDLDEVTSTVHGSGNGRSIIAGEGYSLAPAGVPRACRLLRDDGSTVAVLALTSPFYDDMSRRRGSVVVVIDDPERSATLATLHTRNRMFAVTESLIGLACWETACFGEPVVYSAGVRRLLGLEPGQPLPGEAEIAARIHEEDRPAYLALLDRALHEGGRWDCEARMLGFDGVERTLRMRGHVEPGRAGTRRRAWGVITDTTAVREAEREMRSARDLFSRVVDAATEQCIVATDAAGAITLFNSGAQRMLGYSAEEVLGTSWNRLFEPQELQLFAIEHGAAGGFEAFAAIALAGTQRNRHWTFLTKGGSRRTVAVSATAMVDADGHPTGYIGIGTDVTRQLSAERALRASEERFRLAFDGAPIGMAMLGAGPDHGRLFRVNRALCRLVGQTEEELLGRALASITHPDDASATERSLAELLEGGLSSSQGELRLRHADGRELWVLVSTSLVRDEVNDPRYFVMQVEDITARKEAEQELSHRALHDPLTGLPNRMLLLDHLNGALARAERQGTHVAVMFLDLDNFKDVNDSLGHDAGDELLVDIAQRLRKCLRETDTAARLGGDEFVVVCEGLAHPVEASISAARIERALHTEITLRDTTLKVTVSVGIATSRGDAESADLLRDADAAMYRAKAGGPGRYEIADPALHARALRQTQVESELRAALAGGQLDLHYLPAYDLSSGRLVAVEALVRWQHPARGLLEPTDFLGVAEERGISVELGAWVLENACRQAAGWQRRHGDQAPALWVNVSGKQLGRHHLARQVQAALESSGLEPHRLWLELTERQLMSSARSVQADLLALPALGVHLAVDDVGADFSGLDYLRRLPVDALKIDPCCIGGLGSSGSDSALTRSVVTLAHALDLTVVAGGVETDEQREELRQLGCDLAQGFTLQRPIPADAVEALLTAPAPPAPRPPPTA